MIRKFFFPNVSQEKRLEDFCLSKILIRKKITVRPNWFPQTIIKTLKSSGVARRCSTVGTFCNFWHLARFCRPTPGALHSSQERNVITAPTPSLPFLEQRWGQIRPDIQQADDYNWVPPDQIIMSHFIHVSSGFQYQPNNFLKAFPKSVTIKIAEQKRQAQVLTGRGGETVSSG